MESTALSVKLKWQKNIQSISRLLRERPHPGLQNEPPLDSLDPQSPNPFMASPSPDPIQRLAMEGFRDWDLDYQVGAHFEALDEGVCVAALKSTGYFPSFNIPLRDGIKNGPKPNKASTAGLSGITGMSG